MSHTFFSIGCHEILIVASLLLNNGIVFIQFLESNLLQVRLPFLKKKHLFVSFCEFPIHITCFLFICMHFLHIKKTFRLSYVLQTGFLLLAIVF